MNNVFIYIIIAIQKYCNEKAKMSLRTELLHQRCHNDLVKKYFTQTKKVIHFETKKGNCYVIQPCDYQSETYKNCFVDTQSMCFNNQWQIRQDKTNLSL